MAKAPRFKFKKNKSMEIRAEFSEYNGKRFLNMREWYEDRDTEEMRPGKGFTIPLNKVEDFFEALKEWMDEVEVPDADDEAPKKSKRSKDEDEDDEDEDKPAKKSKKRKTKKF